jgi:hypothetical protein
MLIWDKSFIPFTVQNLQKVIFGQKNYVKIVDHIKLFSKYDVVQFHKHKLSSFKGIILEYLICLGDLRTLIEWYQLYPVYFQDPSIIDMAAALSHFHIVEWLWELSIDEKNQFKFQYTYRAIAEAAIKNNLGMLEWFWDKSIVNSKNRIEFKYFFKIIDRCAEEGLIDVIKWFWDKSNYPNSVVLFAPNKSTIKLAEKNGHKDVAQFLKWTLNQRNLFNLN